MKPNMTLFQMDLAKNKMVLELLMMYGLNVCVVFQLAKRNIFVHISTVVIPVVE